jgi:hypothetical protein
MEKALPILLCFIATFYINSINREIDNNKNLEALITVDNDPIIQLNHFKLVISETEEIKAEYKVGRVIISDKDFIRLEKAETVRLVFDYYIGECCLKERKYNIELSKDLLLQGFLYLRIYNFELYPKFFIKNNGYGFEYESPIISTSLPTRKKINIIYEEPKNCKK